MSSVSSIELELAGILGMGLGSERGGGRDRAIAYSQPAEAAVLLDPVFSGFEGARHFRGVPVWCGGAFTAPSLGRRIQLAEAAVLENPENPSFEGARHFMGVPDRRGGALIAPSLISFVASELGKEAAVLQEKRKAREARGGRGDHRGGRGRGRGADGQGSGD